MFGQDIYENGVNWVNGWCEQFRIEHSVLGTTCFGYYVSPRQYLLGLVVLILLFLFNFKSRAPNLCTLNDSGLLYVLIDSTVFDFDCSATPFLETIG